MYILLQGRTMTHLDDGRLRALLDEELSDADYGAVRIHLAECETCRTRMTKLEERGALVTQALGRLITAAPTEGARTAVLERLGSLPNGKRVGPALPVAAVKRPRVKSRMRVLGMPLARAAILVLLLGAGLATALPASPVRGWIAAGWALAADLFDTQDNAVTPLGPPEEAAVPISDGSVGAQDGTLPGVRRDAAGEGVTIVLREISPGSLIVVRLEPGGEAGAFAGLPATFGIAEGRLEVTGASNFVFVNLPLEAAAASVEVNGGTYLSWAGGSLEVLGPVVARTPEEIQLRVP